MEEKLRFTPGPNAPEGAEELFEITAAWIHRLWAHWMRHMFSQCEKDKRGRYIIPKNLVERWMRQMSRPYRDLTEKEQNSDRAFVASLMQVFRDGGFAITKRASVMLKFGLKSNEGNERAELTVD